MTPHICDHILQPAQGCSCSKHCLELLPAPFPLPWEPWRCLTPREWNIHTLWVRFPCCPLCSPSRCILMRLGAGSGSRAAVWALCSWDSSFPPLPLYSHTAGAAVGCEHMEVEVQKWGCRISASSKFHGMGLYYLTCVCLKGRVSLGSEDLEAFSSSN